MEDFAGLGVHRPELIVKRLIIKVVVSIEYAPASCVSCGLCELFSAWHQPETREEN